MPVIDHRIAMKWLGFWTKAILYIYLMMCLTAMNIYSCIQIMLDNYNSELVDEL